jgi:hypothetical protein
MSYPTHTTTSALSKPQPVTSWACMPAVPSESGWEKGTAPFAMKVVATGSRRRSTKSSSSALARPRITPLPARTTGYLAAESTSAA